MADLLPAVIDSGNDVCINFLETMHKQISNHSGYSFNFKGFSESMLDGAVHMIYALRGMKLKRLVSMRFSIDTIESKTMTDFFQHFYYVRDIIFKGVPMTKSLVESIAVWLPKLETEDPITKNIEEINFSGCGLTDEMLEILAPHLALIQTVNLADNPALTREGYQPLIKAVQDTTTPEMEPRRARWLNALHVNADDKEYLEGALPDFMRLNKL